MITVISAKPMKSDSIPPPEAGDDVKAKEKPIKVMLYQCYHMYNYHDRFIV